MNMGEYMNKEVPVYDCVVTEEQWLDVKFTNKKYLEEEAEKLQEVKPSGNVFSKWFSGLNKKADVTNEQSFIPIEHDYEQMPVDSEQEEHLVATSIPRKSIPSKYTGWFTKSKRAIAIGLITVALLVGMKYVDSGFAGEVFTNARTAYTSTITSNIKVKQTIDLPIVYIVASIADGNVMIQGGRIVFSISEGVVASVFEDCIEIKVNDRLSIIYSVLTDVYVEEGQTITTNTALGKYEDSTYISFVYDGLKVMNVTTDNKSITYQV